MKNKILKHLTIMGYMKRFDLSDCELSAKRLEDAKVNMKDAKKNIRAAKEELNVALGNSIKKIEQG
jgi:hypothetical protein